MQLQHGARAGVTSVPAATLARKAFANRVLAVETNAGEVRIPSMPVINDYLRRERDKRKQPGISDQPTLEIDDHFPDSWTPRPDQKAPDADRGVVEIQFISATVDVPMKEMPERPKRGPQREIPHEAPPGPDVGNLPTRWRLPVPDPDPRRQVN